MKYVLTAFMLFFLQVFGLALVQLIPALAFAQGTQTIETCNAITWDANTEPDLAGYNVFFGKVGEAQTSVTVNAPATSLPCDQTTIVEGASYRANVLAFDQSGNESAPTDDLIIHWPDGTPPDTPSTFCVQGTSGGQPVQICTTVTP